MTIRTWYEVLLLAAFGSKRLREKYRRIWLLAQSMRIAELHRKGLSAAVIASQIGARPEFVLVELRRLRESEHLTNNQHGRRSHDDSKE